MDSQQRATFRACDMTTRRRKVTNTKTRACAQRAQMAATQQHNDDVIYAYVKNRQNEKQTAYWSRWLGGDGTTKGTATHGIIANRQKTAHTAFIKYIVY